MNEFNTHQVRFKVVIKIIFTGLGKTKNYKTWVKKFPLTSSRFPVTINLARKIYFTDCFSAKRKCYQCLEIHAISLEGTRLRCTSLLFFSK